MTTVQTLTGPLQGGGVTAQGTPDMTVAVAAGFDIVANTVTAVAAGNLTIGAADATHDRIDAIVADSSGTKSVIAGAIADGAAALVPDTTGFSVHGLVYVFNQASSAYTGTVTSTMISSVGNVAAWDTTGLLAYVSLSEPANTMAFTGVSGAQADADPGSGNLAFDAATVGAITKCIVSHTSPIASEAIWPFLGIIAYGTFLLPARAKLWSRKKNSRFVEIEVSAVTDHATWTTLTCTVKDTSHGTVPAANTDPFAVLSTDAADLIFEWNGFPPPATTGRYVTTVNILNGTTSYTPSAGVGSLYVEAVGGGGASGGTSTTTTTGASTAGGGGGAYSASKIGSVNVTSHTVAVGAGGTVGTAGANPGNAGGDTSYTKATGETGTAPLAKGGGGSVGLTGTTTGAGGGQPGAGGASGSGTGDIKTNGGDGLGGVCNVTTTSGLGGSGGSGFFSGMVAGTALSIAGKNTGVVGGPYGGGAAGAIDIKQNTTQTGSAGANGLLRITEYT